MYCNGSIFNETDFSTNFRDFYKNIVPCVAFLSITLLWIKKDFLTDHRGSLLSNLVKQPGLFLDFELHFIFRHPSQKFKPNPK